MILLTYFGLVPDPGTASVWSRLSGTG